MVGCVPAGKYVAKVLQAVVRCRVTLSLCSSFLSRPCYRSSSPLFCVAHVPLSLSLVQLQQGGRWRTPTLTNNLANQIKSDTDSGTAKSSYHGAGQYMVCGIPLRGPSWLRFV